MTVFWVVTPRDSIDAYHRFGATYQFHLRAVYGNKCSKTIGLSHLLLQFFVQSTKPKLIHFQMLGAFTFPLSCRFE